MVFTLQNKRIVITGGTSGIGLEMVRQLYGPNELIVIGRNPEKLAQLSGQFPGIATFIADLSDIVQTVKTAQDIAARYRHLDGLINNAASQSETHFTDPAFNPHTINAEIATNFTSLCLLTHGLLPTLRRASDARILNINSALAITPKKSSAVYCATKGAVNIFTRSLRYQLEETNVRVQQAFMPLVDTAMTAGRGAGKVSAAYAAARALYGLKHGIADHMIGKTKLLKLLHMLVPPLSYRILKEA